ncbi:MAG: RHS repeat-associated core domain-containing protein [Chitinophagales bacterium]|nr:RHS repeat-associated core domain-containing protein [Chitinophagales bacterium]
MEQNGNWYATVTPDNNKLYNGKGLNRDFDINLYDYGARWYDPAIGRWSTIDPLAEEFFAYSPYSYVINNPIALIDPTGMKPEDIYLLFWEGNEDTPGHAAIAIDEYDSEGNKTGNVTVYELYAGEEYTTYTMPNSTLDANYRVHSGITLSEAQTKLGPDGVIQVATSKDQDQKTLSKLSSMKTNSDLSVNKYNAETNNCCDIVTKGLEEVYPTSKDMGNTNVKFKVRGFTLNQGEVTNPNKLWNGLRKQPGAKVIKGADRDYDAEAPQKYLDKQVKIKKGY